MGDEAGFRVADISAFCSRPSRRTSRKNFGRKLHSTFGQTAPSLAYAPWPKFDPALLVESEIEIPVQVNGKFRDVIKVPVDADNAAIEAAAKASEKVQPFIAGKTIKKVIIVPKKMVNLIVGCSGFRQKAARQRSRKVCGASADSPLRFFPARQNRLEMRRLFLGGDDADFDLLETGGFEPAVQIALGKTQPAVAVKFARLVEVVLEQIENQNLPARLQNFVRGGNGAAGFSA